MDDRYLIAELNRGSDEAFSKIYVKYWRQVYNFTRLYITKKEEAKDIVQNVFVKVWEARETIREDKNFNGWLFIVTRNLIFNTYRSSFNENAYMETLQSALDIPYDIDEEIEAHDMEVFIDSLIDKLPPRRKEVFNLSRKRNKSVSEIADIMGVSMKTVENQMTEAIKFLRKNISH